MSLAQLPSAILCFTEFHNWAISNLKSQDHLVPLLVRGIKPPFTSSCRLKYFAELDEEPQTGCGTKGEMKRWAEKVNFGFASM